jgi:hypothetical protein
MAEPLATASGSATCGTTDTPLCAGNVVAGNEVSDCSNSELRIELLSELSLK